MAEVTNDLIYEVLKSMNDRTGHMEGALSEVEGELTASFHPAPDAAKPKRPVLDRRE